MSRPPVHAVISPPTIKDVAAAAGVSVTTVSHVLNSKGRVDPATRRLVQEVARDLGYRPNRSAQSLRSGRTGTLGLLLPQLADIAPPELLNSEWYAQVSICVARAAFAEDRALLMLPIDNEPERFLPMVDGVIAVDPMEADPRLAALDRAGAALVTLDSYDATRPHGLHVLPDIAGGVASLLDHLHDNGARKIAALYADIGWAPLATSLEAYRAWMRDKDAAERLEPVDIRRTATIDAVHAASYRRARDCLEGPDRPDAIVALFGGFGVEAARAARDLGLDCPSDILIAQDLDGPQERLMDPAITALDVRPDLQAKAAVAMVLRVLEGEEPGSAITPVELRIRASTVRRAGAASEMRR